MSHEEIEGKTEQANIESTEFARRTTLKSLGLGVLALVTGRAMTGSAQAQGEMRTLQRQGAPKVGRPIMTMQPGTKTFISSNNVNDLRQVRLPNVSKPFEELTISELTQLRPGANAADSYSIEAVGSDISVSSSSILANLARARGNEAVQTQSERLVPGAKLQIQGR